ncbi:MAG: ATP-binding protein [Gemmataceae bacterium]
MNRRLLIQVASPGVIIGLMLLAACFVSAWSVNKLQTNLSRILKDNVITQSATRDVEISLRKLRYFCLLYLVDPNPPLLEEIKNINQDLQQSLERAKQSAYTDQEKQLVQQIEDGYDRYLREFEHRKAEIDRTGPRTDFAQLANSNPIRHVVVPCEELQLVNERMMRSTALENERVSAKLRLALVLVGLVGPLSGLIIGYGVTRGLTRTIYRLSVHVHDISQRLDQDVGAVSVAADSDILQLDEQLQRIVHQVEEVGQRLQQQHREMIRAQQLSAVGQLAASVAHEVRNPLTSIKMLVDSALRSRNAKPMTMDDLQVIRNEVLRLEQTVQSFLNFARLPTPRRCQEDLRDIVAQAVELVRVRARQQDVEIDAKFPEQAVIGYVDGNQLCTVLVNLFINALDAMPHGGQLEVGLEQLPKRGICLRVSDSGSGIPAVVASRLFTPFISTKPTGTGLGLSISQRIIEEHGGHITAENRTAGGACFTILLPIPSPQENRHANSVSH